MLFLSLWLCLAVAAAEPERPAGLLLEAEANPGAGEVVEVEGALGGRAVTSAKGWQPLFLTDLPPGEGFAVWVRHRGGALCLKQVAADGRQREIKWLWDKPEAWTWSKFGVFTAAELGPRLLLMRNREGEPAPLVDAVVLAPEVPRTLPPYEPRADLPTEPVALTIDWDTVAGTIGPPIWGVNDYEIMDPRKAADPALKAFLAELRPGLVRIHNAGLADAWTSAATRDWNVDKIRAGFAALDGYGEARLMLNIPRWPTWLSTEPLLTEALEDELATLVGRLARLFRDEINRPVDWWEILNEQDEAYDKAGRLGDLWRLLNKLERAIRTELPGARVGGPALRWPNPQWVRAYLAGCPGADFLSWHHYGTGDLYLPNDQLLARTDWMGDVPRSLRELAGRRELFLTEYNVKYTWDPFERRHANNVGAVFQACVLRKAALAGIDGVCVWHLKGNAYGLLDGANTIRPTGRLYLWGRPWLTGRIATATSGDAAKLEALPVLRADGRSLLLINKAEPSLLIPPQPGLTARGRIDSAGLTDGPALADPWRLPGWSVTLYGEP